MNYVGIDIHKRYRVCATQDEKGRRRRGDRIESNSASTRIALEIDPSRVPVSLDGEVEIMEAPLRHRLLFDALRVRVPLGTIVGRE